MKPESLKEFTERDLARLGEEMHRFASELYPTCRSITGDGIRLTLARIGERIPLTISEIPTGTEVFDWTIPKEWNIRDAYIKNMRGDRIVDFQQHNLHVMSYSVPVHAVVPLSELRPHLHTLPDHPDWIPYRTSYYREDWGLCLPDTQLQALEDADYEVCIDSTLEKGSLTFGECFLRGRSTEEVLISCHACHPSLANDNLSGLAVATEMAKALATKELHYSYRFLFIPGTIGAIAWLARNRDVARRVRHGLVLTCVGDAGGFHYKKSRRGDAEIDRVMTQLLRYCAEPAETLEFSPYGYDERQYCSPGFDLPVGCLMRSKWGTFPEYHTSADNLEFIHPKQLAGTLRLCLSACDVLERNGIYLNQNPFCEPQLGKRNLYQSKGGAPINDEINARLWVLNQSDGRNSLLDIAERSGLPFAAIADAAELLRENGLLTKADIAVDAAGRNEKKVDTSAR
jgi:aminopeptidase-like protein